MHLKSIEFGRPLSKTPCTKGLSEIFLGLESITFHHDGSSEKRPSGNFDRWTVASSFDVRRYCAPPGEAIVTLGCGDSPAHIACPELCNAMVEVAITMFSSHELIPISASEQDRPFRLTGIFGFGKKTWGNRPLWVSTAYQRIGDWTSLNEFRGFM